MKLILFNFLFKKENINKKNLYFYNLFSNNK